MREDTQRTLARGVLVAWLLPIFMTFLTALFVSTPQEAYAQSTATSPTVTIVVLDFDVAPGLDPVLGRKAADAMAVELKNSGNFEVVTRQRVEKAISEQPGLTAPFTPATQVRLAQILGAQGVISGRVISAATPNNRAARTQVEARQLDAATGDIVNGASVNEATTDKLQAIDPDILLDEAINKSAFSLVRIMGQTRLSEGTVLNTTATDVELNLGARNGVAPGQTYSVLRDVLNRSTNIVERVKVAEIKILNVEADASTAQVVAGGDTGVRTGDKVRLIFVPRPANPVSPTGAGSNSIQLPPATRSAGGPGVVKKAGKGLGGLLGLGLLVALAGFAGGSSGSRPSSAPTGVVAKPAYSGSTPIVNVNYSSGLPGILAGDNVVGYFIYRSTDSGFSADARTLIEFVQGDQRSFTDVAYGPALIRRQVRIDVAGSNGNNSSNGTNNSGPPVITIDTSGPPDPADLTTSFVSGTNFIEAKFLYTPPVPGTQYFYKIRRVTGSAPPGDVGGDNNNSSNNGSNNGSNNSSNNSTSDQLLPVLSQPSSASGGATLVVRPVVASTNGNLDNLVITGRVANLADADNPNGGITADDQLVVQIVPDGQVGSRFEQTFTIPGSFPSSNTTTIGVSTLNQDGTFNINLGDIALQNYTAGDPIDIRIGIRNTADNPGFDPDSRTQEQFSFSPIFVVNAPTGRSFVGSRSVTSGAAGQRRSGGVGLPGSSLGDPTRGGARRSPGYILRPH